MITRGTFRNIPKCPLFYAYAYAHSQLTINHQSAAQIEQTSSEFFPSARQNHTYLSPLL